MTSQPRPLERLRAANPAPVEVEPDWSHIRERVRCDSGASAGRRTGVISPASARLQFFGVLAVHPSPAHRRWNRYHGRLALAGLTLCVVVAAGILITPRSGESDLLVRTAFALAPRKGTILYERWRTFIAPEPGNGIYKNGAAFGPEQLWIEGTGMRRYRAILEPRSDSNAAAGRSSLSDVYGVNVGYVGNGLNLAAGDNEILNRLYREVAGQALEIGGTLEAVGSTTSRAVTPTLTFLPTNKLFSARLSVTLGASLPGPHEEIIEGGADPVSALHAAILEGRAHEAGYAQMDGRKVLRIDLDLPKHPPAGAPVHPPGAPAIRTEAYAYVESGTFRPLEIVFGDTSYRFMAYERLPASAANLALTSIQAQHPTATVIKEDSQLFNAG